MSETKKTCFVIGPMGPDGSATRIAADWLLKGIIRPVLVANGFVVIRADEIPEQGLIDVQLINRVLDATLVVADLSERNPNAFYELALRHMAQRPIIHMINKSESIPFDVSTFRAIRFSTTGFDEVEDAKSPSGNEVFGFNFLRGVAPGAGGRRGGPS